MIAVVLILHILVCFALMGVVLMQSGKGKGLAGAFGGGGGNQTVFGGRGAVDFLGKATWFLGGAFMVTSLTLAILYGATGKGSVGEGLLKKQATTEQAPMTPPTGGDQGGAPVTPSEVPPATPPTAQPSGGK